MRRVFAISLLVLAAALPSLVATAPYSNGGGLRNCPYGIIDSAQHGTWYTGQLKACFCNDGKWERCYDINSSPTYAEPPYIPVGCYENGRQIQHGQWYDLIIGQTCMCDDGEWQQCKPKYTPPAYVPPKACTDYSDTVPHNSWHMRSTGLECLCRDGIWSDCKNPPNKCTYKATSAWQGGYLDTDTQRCRCDYGNLVDCEDLCQAGKAQLMFLFDTSASIMEDENSESDSEVGTENWMSMQDFTASAIRQLPIGPWKTMVSLARFSDIPSTQLSFKSPDSGDKNAILRNLYSWRPQLKGDTYLARAMDFIQDEFTGTYQWAKILVVLTDGNADDNIERISKEMREDGYIIFAVGVGKNIEVDKLLSLTGDRGKILMVNSFSALSQHLEFLTKAVCFNYNV